MHLFTALYLMRGMERVGLVKVTPLGREQAQGIDHGWISLGFSGVKR